MIQAIIFDFDGVIVNSNSIKKKAYFTAFSKIKDSKEVIEESIKENFKKTRYAIIEDILKKLKEKNIAQFEDLESERDKYVSYYSEITEKETICSEEIAGAEQTLDNLSQKYPLFVLTSTIQKSINRVVKGRKLKKYFKGIYGTNSNDSNKIQILERIAKEYDFDPKKSIFVGDGKEDYECASHYGMRFVAVINETNNFKDRQEIKWKIEDLQKLPEIIEVINESI